MFTINSPQKQSSRTLFALFLCIFTLSGTPATAQDALLASDVSMDVTGKNPTDAREQAMSKAEREGLSILLEKLAPDQKTALMSRLSDSVISAMVKSVEVQDEKIAGNRYKAMLKVSYNALAVNALLDRKVSAETPAEVELPSTSVLVLPLYEEEGQTLLWEPNAWRDAWKRVIMETSGGNVLTPYADKADTDAVSTETLPAANFNALMPFFNRYGVGEIVVMKAALRAGTPETLDIMRRHIGKNRNETLVTEYRADPQETRADLLLRAARDLMSQVGSLREENIARRAMETSTEARLMVLIPMTTLDSWTRVRAALLKLPTITRVDVLAISPQQVDAMLQHKGPRPILAADIQAAGLRVIQTDNYWIISKD